MSFNAIRENNILVKISEIYNMFRPSTFYMTCFNYISDNNG